MRTITATAAVLLMASLVLAQQRNGHNEGVLPVGDDGKPLNFDFETGNLQDWTATGEAFDGQPIKGDTVEPRRKDMASNHAGRFWIGTYEVAGDKPTGTLTSRPFRLTHPWASFLIGGGSGADTYVDIIWTANGATLFRYSGADDETMQRVAVDLQQHKNKQVIIRIVDNATGHWGHINFDDFRFHSSKPDIVERPNLVADEVKNAGLEPEQAVAEMTLPPDTTATLFAGEPDVNQPVAFTIDDRGRLWVAEAWAYPVRRADDEARDRIIIFEDSDGDGRHDKRTVFADKLNLVSGLEVGFGGVWVGAAPYLMFIPDRDDDDKPDGPPQILLDGWGYQDTHETLNTFNWGPDGWLYGCHGVFTHSKVGKPGTPDEQRIGINAGYWRYHPTKHIFEVFAEGTSNPWGIDFNDHGQAFATACVIPHLYHVIQGARYQRQAGQHFNPHIFRDIQHIGDHVHWAGDRGPHAGNNKSDTAGGGHAHCGAMVYLGDKFPADFRNSIFMSNIHGNRINNDRLVPRGSGYVGTHAPDMLLMNDKWSRLINLRYGPDGGIFVIDWYDKQACHRTEEDIWDRTNGRIFKLTYKGTRPVNVHLSKLSDDELVQLQLHRNDWYVRVARRILQERGPNPAVHAALLDILRNNEDETRQLRALWALHVTQGLSEQIVQEQLRSPHPYVRAWTIQLAAEDGQAEELISTFVEMARSDESPVVRLYLASALQRLRLEQRGEVLLALAAHGEDAGDHNLPYMYWYAAEALVGADIGFAMTLARQTQIPLLREFASRRLAAMAQSSAE